jgi:atypical dual specificity phosphatase
MLAEEGIKAVVSLDELGLDPGLLQEYQMEYLHSPIVDFSVPTLQQAMEVVRFIERCAEREKPVLVHCAAGIGRTGTMLACWFVSRGMSALEAIRHVRKLRPFSIETPEQEQFVQSFEEHIRSGA